MAKHSKGPQFWWDVRLQEAVFRSEVTYPAVPQLSCKLPAWPTPKLMATTATTPGPEGSFLSSGRKAGTCSQELGCLLLGSLQKLLLGTGPSVAWPQICPQDAQAGTKCRAWAAGVTGTQCRDPTHRLDSAFWDWSLELRSPTFLCQENVICISNYKSNTCSMSEISQISRHLQFFLKIISFNPNPWKIDCSSG